MANNYGVANTVPIGVSISIIAGQNCPAGVETTIASGVFAALDPSGWYYVEALIACQYILGATPPSNIAMAARIGAGADIGTYNVATGLLVASATFTFTSALLSVASQAPWQGAGSTLNITCNPTGQAVTAGSTGSRTIIHLWRAPDQ